jgi:ABC-2 type transport system ATP-binding protein
MSSPTDSVVSLDRLTIRYGRTTAVGGISLQVPRGSVYALLGRNGAGKTSTVRCLLGQWKATAGSAALFGRDVWRERARLMARVGVVLERDEAPPSMTAGQLERLFARLYPTWDRSAVLDRLERFSVPPDRAFGKLSRGQQRQLSLALALASSPELLVLDDPTLGLDAVARRELLDELIGELADRGTTVFVATNDIAGIEPVADRVGVLRNGELVVDQEMDELKSRYRRIRTAAAVEAEHPVANAEVVASRKVAGGVETVIRYRGSGTTGEDLGAGIEVHAMSLEEIFVALCGPANGGSS